MLANSAWPSLRRLVQSVSLMMTVMLLLSDRGRKDCRLLSTYTCVTILNDGPYTLL